MDDIIDIPKELYRYNIIPYIGGLPWDFVEQENINKEKCCVVCGRKKHHIKEEQIQFIIDTSNINDTTELEKMNRYEMDVYVRELQLCDDRIFEYDEQDKIISNHKLFGNLIYIPLSKIKMPIDLSSNSKLFWEKRLLSTYIHYKIVCSWRCYNIPSFIIETGQLTEIT